ncbi:MAG: hypothetical protein ACM3U2_03965 [Deltaproteobacteria bacterium]
MATSNVALMIDAFLEDMFQFPFSMDWDSLDGDVSGAPSPSKTKSPEENCFRAGRDSVGIPDHSGMREPRRLPIRPETTERGRRTTTGDATAIDHYVYHGDIYRHILPQRQ